MSNIFPWNYVDLVDTHCHLNDKSFEMDRVDVVDHAVSNGVEMIVDIGVDVESSIKAIKNSQESKGRVKATVGIDPEIFIPGSDLFREENLEVDEDTLSTWVSDLDLLISQANSTSRLEGTGSTIVGVGETGIDLYWLNKKFSEEKIDKEQFRISKRLQEAIFRLHIELAIKYNLFLSIHSRAAEQECLNILNDYPAARAIFHSYTGDLETARNILKAGHGLGINGISTYKNAADILEMYRILFLENGLLPVNGRIEVRDLHQKGFFLESDAPFLAPLSVRGQRNEPMFIKETLGILSRLS